MYVDKYFVCVYNYFHISAKTKIDNISSSNIPLSTAADLAMLTIFSLISSATFDIPSALILI